MDFGGINYLAVFVATIASFAFGAVWYMTNAKPWMKAAALSESDIKGPDGKQDPTPFIFSFLCELVMAFMLAGIIGHLDAPVNVKYALISALFVWVGFVATTQIVNHRYQMKPWSLTIIDAGHWLGVLLIQGLVIGLFGV